MPLQGMVTFGKIAFSSLVAKLGLIATFPVLLLLRSKMSIEHMFATVNRVGDTYLCSFFDMALQPRKVTIVHDCLRIFEGEPSGTLELQLINATRSQTASAATVGAVPASIASRYPDATLLAG